MIKFILQRLLLMVPTFLLITIVVFVVINIAPGRPGQGGSQGSESADQSANAREGYRLFKEQYNLDKPIVLNFRWLLAREDVTDALQTIARNMSGALPGEQQANQVGATTALVISNLVNAEYNQIRQTLAIATLTDEERETLQRRSQNLGFARIDPVRFARPSQGDVFEAEEDIENWGQTIVPFLVEIASQYVYLVPEGAASPMYDGVPALLSELDGAPAAVVGAARVTMGGTAYTVQPVMTAKVRFLAVQRLSVNARRMVLVRPGERADEETAARNRTIVSENNTIARWVYPLSASTDEIQAVTGQWQAWFDENAARWQIGFGGKVYMTFVETRFAKYFMNLARLDLGTSIRYRRPVTEIIASHWKYSIFLSVASLILAYFISIPLGVLAAVRQNQFADRGIGIFLFVLYSLPSFFAATLLQTYLTPASAGQYAWLPSFAQIFPVSGFYGQDPMTVTAWQHLKDILWHLVLPLFCLTYGSLAVLSRFARTGLLDVVRSDYIRTARAKGLSEWVVILKHAVRNGMIPILTLLGTTLPVLIGGSIIIEYIFVIDGMGKLMITAIQFRDYNIIMGILLISSILTLIGILLSDISYALVDPRISFD